MIITIINLFHTVSIILRFERREKLPEQGASGTQFITCMVLVFHGLAYKVNTLQHPQFLTRTMEDNLSTRLACVTLHGWV